MAGDCCLLWASGPAFLLAAVALARAAPGWVALPHLGWLWAPCWGQMWAPVSALVAAAADHWACGLSSGLAHPPCRSLHMHWPQTQVAQLD